MLWQPFCWSWRTALYKGCSIGFIKFNQKPVNNYGSTFLSWPFNFLIAKLRVDLRCSVDCLRPNLITLWVDTQLQNGFWDESLVCWRVLKTTRSQKSHNMKNEYRRSTQKIDGFREVLMWLEWNKVFKNNGWQLIVGPEGTRRPHG